MSTSLLGTSAATLGVLLSAGIGVLCSVLVKKYDLTGALLIRETAPLQTVFFIFLGPLFDKAFVGTFPWDWSGWQTVLVSNCVAVMIGTCVLAALVNLSLVACIKKYSASGES